MNEVVYKNVKPLIEGLKDMARVLLLGVLPIIIASINTQTGEIVVNWSIIKATALTVVLTAILKGLDKDRHLNGKLEGDDNKVKGLTQF